MKSKSPPKTSRTYNLNQEDVVNFIRTKFLNKSRLNIIKKNLSNEGIKILFKVKPPN